jgi:hypothetical protein
VPLKTDDYQGTDLKEGWQYPDRVLLLPQPSGILGAKIRKMNGRKKRMYRPGSPFHMFLKTWI